MLFPESLSACRANRTRPWQHGTSITATVSDLMSFARMMAVSFSR